LAESFSDLLTDDGSIVIELGNAWVPGKPVQSTLHLESLLGFMKEAKLKLCQEFICYNPARLPSPAQWVTIERIRAIDSFTHVWWLSKSDRPKADNRKVLRPYSDSMKTLLRNGSYNSGMRPSEHNISKNGFLKKNKGSIPHNVIQLDKFEEKDDLRLPQNILRIANTGSNEYFLKMCKEKKIIPHPARMPAELAAFFIEFLTDKGDLVLDPFAGSNTTGFCSEFLYRKWLAIEALKIYGIQSKIRFGDPTLKKISQKRKRRR
jgi:site-specific DNA-methyltransferase (cytosine-N4-specific)